jgi:predicted dinucleotide-binding enzyme
VQIANTRGPESLRDELHRLDGAQPAAPTEAVASAELVLLALPWRSREALAAYGPWDGKIVVDATNPYGSAGELLDTGGRGSSELVAEAVPGARLVKAFNTMHWMRLRDEGRPGTDEAERLVIFLAGDDAPAKDAVAGLVRELGFAPVDAGSLREGGRLLEPGTELYNVPLVPAQAAELLS